MSPPEASPGAPAPTLRAYVGLGANLGEAPATLAGAVAALGSLPEARLEGVSRLYRTRPVGLAEQPDFHNAAVGLIVPEGPRPEEGALALLLALKSLERAFGRQERKRWGPRELDLDLLVFGPHALRAERPVSARSEDPDRPGRQWLEVPHPRAAERLFVLAPLADLAPDLVPPGWTETVAAATARARSVEGEAAVRPVAGWDPLGRRWRATRPTSGTALATDP